MAVIIKFLFEGCIFSKKWFKSVCVLERRHVIGGAAVTEEIVPGQYIH